MNQRNTLQLLFALGVTPLVSVAQQSGKVWRIGFLDLGSRQSAVDAGRFDALLNGLRELGYVVGRNLVFEMRNADGSVERLDGLAVDLVRMKVDVILTFGTAASQAAQRTTTTIPIVVISTIDPVRDRLAATLARPGSNITGMSIGPSAIVQKYVELLRTRQQISGLALKHRLPSIAMISEYAEAGALMSYGPA